MEENLREKINEIILYHGSLEELNSRDPHKQYQFTNDLFFASNLDGPFMSVPSYFRVKKQIFDSNYVGLVDMKTIFGGQDSQEGKFYFVEGTPIVKNKE